ncbi:hypothetical protein Unana1_05854 [Umbelopsis nana]
METKLKKLLFRSSRIDLPVRWSTPQRPSDYTPPQPQPSRQSLDCPPRLDTATPTKFRTWRKPLPKGAPNIKVVTKPDYKQMDRSVSQALNALSACDFHELPQQMKVDLVRQQLAKDKRPTTELRTLGKASSLYPKNSVQNTISAPIQPAYPVRRTSQSYQNNPQVAACLLDLDKNVNQRLSRRSMESNVSDNTSGEESQGPPTPTKHSFSAMTTSKLSTSLPPEPPKHHFELPQIVMTTAQSPTQVAPKEELAANDQIEKTVYLRPKVASIKRNGSLRRKRSARRHVSLRRHVNAILSGAFDEADDEWENESEEDDQDAPLEVLSRRSLQIDSSPFACQQSIHT